MCVCVCIYIYIYIYIYILWRVGCLPLIISISPSLNRRPSPGSLREWVCERGGALKQPGLAACDEAHLKWMEPHHRRCYMPSAPLLWRPVSSPCMHAGVLVGPGRERWGIECRTHPWDGWRARMPGRLIPRSAAGRRKTKPLKKPPPLAPRTSEGSACGRRTPPLTWTLPSRTLPLLHNPRSTTRTPDPLFILDTSSPLDTLFYYFCWIKASPRPDATPTVSVFCSSRHSGGECGQGGA